MLPVIASGSIFLLYRELRSYTIKILSYCRAKFFEKQKIAFQKCTWLKKSEFAPHVRRRAERRSRFSCSDTVLIYVNSHFNSGGEIYAKRKRIGTEETGCC